MTEEERHRDTWLRKQYGISHTQYNRLLTEQNHVCFICQGTDCFSDYLAVDHCHKTGTVRGLLCRNCNRALGQLQDSLQLLNRAVTYLSRTPPDLSDLDPKKPPKPHSHRARIRYEVATPDGKFNSYEAAGSHYNVHSCTVRDWCDPNSPRKKTGFSATKTFKRLDE